MAKEEIVCLINEGLYKHPVFLRKENCFNLLQYCSLDELNDSVHLYSKEHNTNNVHLEGDRIFVAGIKKQMERDYITKYNETLNITITGDER